jgi:hypothetical protein
MREVTKTPSSTPSDFRLEIDDAITDQILSEPIRNLAMGDFTMEDFTPGPVEPPLIQTLSQHLLPTINKELGKVTQERHKDFAYRQRR